MAKKLNAETAADAGRNELTPEERHVVNEAACQRLSQLDEERKTFNAAQSKARKEITGGMVKGQLGMAMADWNALIFRPWLLKQDEKNQERYELYQRTQKEAFEFLERGETGDMLKPLDEVGGAGKNGKTAKESKAKATAGKPKKAKKADADGFSDHTDTVEQAGEKGFEAGNGGKNKDTNPYEYGTKHYQAWNTNWTAAQSKLAEGIKQTPESRPH